MQMVFQDPYSSLNPRMTVEDIIGEPLDVHKLYNNRAERRIRYSVLWSWSASMPSMPQDMRTNFRADSGKE
jgi:ABC-type microcin C transport system duplicated ATPase subunit YejF